MNASHALKLVVASIVGLGSVAVADVATAGTSTCTDSGCWVYPPIFPSPGGGELVEAGAVVTVRPIRATSITRSHGVPMPQVTRGTVKVAISTTRRFCR